MHEQVVDGTAVASFCCKPLMSLGSKSVSRDVFSNAHCLVASCWLAIDIGSCVASFFVTSTNTILRSIDRVRVSSLSVIEGNDVVTDISFKLLDLLCSMLLAARSATGSSSR
jgi:hypothetical protein